MNAFRDKYFAIPGDMNNATAFWGVLAGTGSDATCQNTPATGKPTCNGDGNGIINNVAATADEQRRFWQHLGNAEMIEGQYRGTYDGGASNPSNTPASKNPKGSWTPVVTSTVSFTGSTIRFPIPAGASILHRGWSGSPLVADTQALKPEDAWNIDTKVDDGKPGTGNIISVKGDGVQTFCANVAGTSNPATDATAVYVLTNNNRDCDLHFLGL